MARRKAYRNVFTFEKYVFIYVHMYMHMCGLGKARKENYRVGVSGDSKPFSVDSGKQTWVHTSSVCS